MNAIFAKEKGSGSEAKLPELLGKRST